MAITLRGVTEPGACTAPGLLHSVPDGADGLRLHLPAPPRAAHTGNTGCACGPGSIRRGTGFAVLFGPLPYLVGAALAWVFPAISFILYGAVAV